MVFIYKCLGARTSGGKKSKADLKKEKQQAKKNQYLDYLKSNHWKTKRNERLKLDNFQCLECGSKKNLDVHHLTYKSIGFEKVSADLITLCRNCHTLEHKDKIKKKDKNKWIKKGGRQNKIDEKLNIFYWQVNEYCDYTFCE